MDNPKPISQPRGAFAQVSMVDVPLANNPEARQPKPQPAPKPPGRPPLKTATDFTGPCRQVSVKMPEELAEWVGKTAKEWETTKADVLCQALQMMRKIHESVTIQTPLTLYPLQGFQVLMPPPDGPGMAMEPIKPVTEVTVTLDSTKPLSPALEALAPHFYNRAEE